MRRPVFSSRLCCLFLASLLGVLGASCHTRGDVDRQTFVILVEAKGNDFRPVEGLVILGPGGAEIGRTNSDGRALFTAVGQEGESAEFSIQPPPEFLISEGGEKRRVLLKRLRSIGGGYGNINIVDHDIKLRKRNLPYVVLIATNQFAGLPVVVFGIEKTRLNSRGVGMFLHEGKPGDEITVTLLTDSDPRIAPVSPRKTFVLANEPTQYFWRTAFEIRKVEPLRKNGQRKTPGKKRLGPTAI